ncbi:transposase InsO family protein [Variovorax boronicumulans]|nr:transposase InsO family protein [Variovorax boronicumulans]
MAPLARKHVEPMMAQMGAAFEHFNEMHPRSALKLKSPGEFRQLRAAQHQRF